MILNLPLLVLGVLLLWFPRQWMRRGLALLQRKRRSSGSERILEPWKDREPGDPRVNPRVEFAKFRNYVDLLRGFAGGLAVWGGFGIEAALQAGPGAGDGVAWQVLGIKAAVVALGLVIQAIRYERVRLSFFPPIFYLAGLSAALCNYQPAVFAFVLIWIVNAGLGNAQAFLSVYGLLLGGFGALFNGWRSLPVLLVAGLAFLPVLLSLMVKRPLMIFTRKGSR
jgi:hypothetical protein